MESNYFSNNKKISKITEDGLRINVYKSGIVTNQQPYETHKDYARVFDKSFMTMTPDQMSDYAFNFFRVK